MTAPTPAPKDRSPDFRRACLIGSAVCWATFALIALLVTHGWTARSDAAGLLLWRDPQTGGPAGPAWLVPFWRAITHLGDGITRKALGAIVVILLLIRRRAAAALPLVIVILTDGLINDGLKAAFARPRPEIVPHLIGAGGLSFPSGHSFGAAATFLAVALALATPANRRMAIGVAAVLSGLVAFSRVWLGVHYPSDIVAGWTGGAGLALAATALAHIPRHKA